MFTSLFGPSRPAPLLPDGRSPMALAEPVQFARRGLSVAVIAVGVAMLMTVFGKSQRGDHGFWVYLIYSELISLLSWAFIDFGRFLFPHDLITGWPTGWRRMALPVAGCVLGYVIGHAIGDWIFGWSSLDAYRSGQRDVVKDVLSSSLIGFLFSLFFYLRGRSIYHRAQAVTAERDATLAKLGMLQSQLEPHMLFNTLANLRVLIAVDPVQAQAMLDRLIAFLRATLSASRKTAHPLADEFARLDDYLALMAVRMGPRLSYQLDLPSELGATPVPPLLLQPLVENAIKHGLEPAIEGGRIVASARSEGERLVLTVTDSGLGLDAQSGPDKPAGHGFGLTQIRERLSALYGDSASLSLSAPADGGTGTVARIDLPMQLPDHLDATTSIRPEPCTPPH